MINHQFVYAEQSNQSQCWMLMCSGVTRVTLSYPSLWTPAGYRCTGPGTSGPAAGPPPETRLKHNEKETESAESQSESSKVMSESRWVTLSGQIFRWDALHGQRARRPHQRLLRHHLWTRENVTFLFPMEYVFSATRGRSIKTTYQKLSSYDVVM